MAVTRLTRQGNVAILTMVNGENRHNPVFAKEMLERLEAIKADETFKALVIASDDEKCWSLGIDTQWLMPAMQQQQFEDVKAFMYDMDAVFKSLLLYPMPVIAAISGHAFGNGAIMSCACDFRFMRSDKGFFCFPEVDLSIPFLPGQIAFIKKAIPYFRFNEMKLSGRRVAGKELERDHVVEAAVEGSEALLATAISYAETFDKKRGIFAEHKRRLHQSMIDVIDHENPPLIDAVSLMV